MGSTHSRSPQRDSRQIIQTQSDDSDRVVPFSTGVRSLVLDMGTSPCRPLCNPVQSQTSKVCFTDTGSNSLGSGRPECIMGKSECLCLLSNLLAQPSNLKGDGSRLLQDDPDCSRISQHALVLGPGHSFNSGSPQTSATKGSCATTLQQGSAQESQQSDSACLAPRASAIQEQGFSDEVAARIEAPRSLNQSRLQIKVRHFCQMV